MKKEYTGYIKGIAIILMVFLHLFNTSDEITGLNYVISIGDVPLIVYLTRMCNPVPFFLMVSGYGLYAVYSQGGVKPWKRIVNLYVHLWLIYLIFVPLGSWVRPEMYPGSLVKFIENATSWRCSYIGEQWFFLPYILLMLASKWLFKLFSHMRSIWVVIICFAVYTLTVFALKRYGESTLAGNMLFYNIFLSFYMLFPFSLGYLAKREQWMEKLNEVFTKMRLKRNWFILGLLLLLCGGRCFVSHQAIDPFYAFAFVMLFSILAIGKKTGNVLSFLGKYSMTVWLIHPWICIRLFHKFVYDLHYPLLMYLFVLLTSIVVSLIVEHLYRILDSTVLYKLKK